MSVSWEHRPEITDESKRFKLMEEEVREVPEFKTFSEGARRAFMVPIVSKWNMKKKDTRACGSDD